MKHVLFGLLLAVSQCLAFSQDGDKFKTLFSRIDSLERTVHLLSNHFQRQDEINQKRDAAQQMRIEELEGIVRLQQRFINDIIALGGEEKSQTVMADVVKNTVSKEILETQEPLVGKHGSNISHIHASGLDKIGEHLHDKRRAKSLMRQTPEAVAFHATIDVHTHITHLTKGQTIVFDSVHLNTGGGYHSAAGIFIAPTSGIYMFSLSVMLNAPNTWISLDLLKNGAVLAEAYAYGYDQGSVSIATQLKIGDEVIVKVHDSDHGMVYGEKLTSFMGMLVMPY